MKNRLYYKITSGAILFVFALFISSCDELLPRKIDNSSFDNNDEFVYDNDEFTEEELISENVPNDEPFNNAEDFTINSEYDLGVMTIYEFYAGEYFDNREFQPDRLLSKNLKRALKGIRDLEEQTGFLILDADPFINAQDICFTQNDLIVERNGCSDWFTVRCGDTNVQLYLITENDDYLIDNIKLPGGKTITELYEEERGK